MRKPTTADRMLLWAAFAALALLPVSLAAAAEPLITAAPKAAAAAPKTAAGEPENPRLWKPRIRNVAVFKNGLGFFVREGEVGLREGWCVASQVPPAAFGTLAIYSQGDKELVDVVGSGAGEVVQFDGKDAPATVEVKRARLEAAKDLKVQLQYQQKGQDRNATGKLVSVGPEYAVLEDQRQQLRGAHRGRQADAASRSAPADSRAGPGGEAARACYPGHGLPAPRDHLDSRIHAQGARPAERRVDPPRHAGQPGRGPDPQRRPPGGGRAALRPHRLPGADRRGPVDPQHRRGGAVGGEDADHEPCGHRLQLPGRQQFDAGGEEAAEPARPRGLQEALGNLPHLDSAAGTDYTVYTKTDLTLREGEKAILTLFTKKITYSHIYRWSPPAAMEHSLVLHNATDTAWTTGPCLAISAERPLGEDLLRYVPRDGNGELPVTTAINIAEEKTEREIDRKLKAYSPQKT